MNDSEVRRYLEGLLIDCPVHKATADCPFNQLRQKDEEYLNHYIQKLSLDEAAGLIGHHRSCIKRQKMELKRNKGDRI